MSRVLKRLLFALLGAVALLILIALAVVPFVGVDRYKTRLELAASDALGMGVRIGGRLSMGLFPGFHITAEDARILGQGGAAVASAKRARLGIELFPLLRKELRLRRIELTQPRLSIERDSAGRFNVERLKKAVTLLGALDRASVSVADGTLIYADGRSGQRFEATNVNFVVRRMRLASGARPWLSKGFSLKAEVNCGEIRTEDLSVSALKVPIDWNDGIVELKPVTMRVFGGQATGSLRGDLSGAVPLVQLRLSLPGFRIEEFLRILSPNKAAQGTMDFTASLSMRGRTDRQLVETVAGEISLRGGQLTLVGHDLDRALSRYESSQSFNLVDVGAVFLAGPLGLAVTKGYNFASLFRGSGGTTNIGALVSDWRVDRGVAQAKDVAMATPANRIALQGGLDLVNGRFADMTVAVIDAEGCARVQQAIRGPFAKPEVEPPRMLASITGPLRKLYRQTKSLFPAKPCEVFYSGSVAPPK